MPRPTLSSVLDIRGWGCMARQCPTPASPLNQPGGTEGMQLTPCQQQLHQPTIGPPHSHPNPRPWLTSMRAPQQTGSWEGTPTVPFLNPDPTAHLVGQSNESPHHCQQAEGDHIDWLEGTGLQHKLQALQMNGSVGLPTRQATRARGYWKLSYPVPGVHRG